MNLHRIWLTVNISRHSAWHASPSLHQYSAELGRLVSLSAQAADINALFGFRLECIERMGDPQGIWAWTRLNALFNWLPLAALIEDRIVCMHGGAPGCFAYAR